METQERTIRVAVAEDEPYLRRDICQAIRRQPGMTLAGEAATEAETVSAVPEGRAGRAALVGGGGPRHPGTRGRGGVRAPPAQPAPLPPPQRGGQRPPGAPPPYPPAPRGAVCGQVPWPLAPSGAQPRTKPAQNQTAPSRLPSLSV